MPHLHPTLQILLLDLLLLWPVMRLYQRVGLRSWWGLLLFADLLAPFFGAMLATAPLAIKAWPKFPDPPSPRQPLKLPI